MFRKYGILGILIIVFVEINFFLQLQPFANWYFPIVWLGYILTVDALVYRIKGSSLINNRFEQFLGMFLISMLFWWIFEFVNIPIENWKYVNLEVFGELTDLAKTISFGTVLPAMFETVELILAVGIFKDKKLKKKHKISKGFLHSMMLLGVFCFLAPIFFPTYAFPLVWGSFFFLLDPINYIHKQPSIIGHIKNRNLKIPLALLLAAIIMGFLWEFWNYWAIPKWTYEIPFVGFFKIFEMPILGYLGYFPFSFELYSMYWFVRSLLIKKEIVLVK